MKHLRKFFESNEDKEDILENFLFISDKLGEPEVRSSRFGNSTKWEIVWDLKLDISVLQEANELVGKLKDLTSDIDDVLAAADRLPEYSINMCITNKLILELVPKETGGDDYKFIKNYESRSLNVRKNEIERFFNSRGVRVVKFDIESSWNEYNQTNDLDIYLNKSDVEAMDDFKRLVNAELRLIDDREYECIGRGTVITIAPIEEKSYIELVVI